MRRLVWIGRYRGTNGFAVATRQYVFTLQQYTKNLCIAPLEVLEENDPLLPLQLPITETDFTVVNHLPTTDPEAHGYLSVWEYDHIPEEWVEIFNRAQLILTQSRFCQEIFAKQIHDPAKIGLVPYILTENFSPTGVKMRFYPKETFIFGSIFEWTPRKTPNLMIQAFVEEFGKDEPVRLLLRTDDFSIMEFIEAQYGDKRIQLLNKPIPEIDSFYRGLDAYVSCTAGEGFGQTMAEAMACGIPTIASRHSGQLDFMNDTNSWLVEVGPWEPSQALPGFQWKLPKVPSIRKAMREVYTLWKQHIHSPRVDKALEVRSRFSADRVGKQLWAALYPFLQS